MVFDMGTGPEPGWVLVLPIKGGVAAKSRLGGGPALARAIAMDCLDAVLACPDVRQVMVVTADRATADDAAEAGAVVLPESRPGSGLVAAVRDGLAAAALPAQGAPDGAGEHPTAVLLGDLPALRPTDLSAGLRAASAALAADHQAPMAAVPDAQGSGTVLLAGRRASDLDPAFGPASLAEHRRRGAVVVDLDLHLGRLEIVSGAASGAARLRHDVDTPDDLRVALALGVGRRTAAMLAAQRSAS